MRKIYGAERQVIHLKKMNGLDWLALILVIVGGLNWGLVGIAKFDLVAAIVGKEFGEVNALSQIVYSLVGLSAVYLAATAPSKSKTSA